MQLDIMQDKLVSLARCMGRIRSKLPADAAALGQDFDSMDVIVINLQRAVQRCTQIAKLRNADLDMNVPRTTTEGFGTLQNQGELDRDLAGKLEEAAALSDRAVNEFDSIDWTVFHATVLSHLKDFQAFMHVAQGWVESYSSRAPA